jgi:hypothetical protein
MAFERAIILSPPYHNGLAFIDPKLCARSPNGQSVATDFNGEIASMTSTASRLKA